jgi:hypothetical protein
LRKKKNAKRRSNKTSSVIRHRWKTARLEYFYFNCFPLSRPRSRSYSIPARIHSGFIDPTISYRYRVKIFDFRSSHFSHKCKPHYCCYAYNNFVSKILKLTETTRDLSLYIASVDCRISIYAQVWCYYVHTYTYFGAIFKRICIYIGTTAMRSQTSLKRTPYYIYENPLFSYIYVL